MTLWNEIVASTFLLLFPVLILICIHFLPLPHKCLIVTDSFAPQVAPFVGFELELWHWVLLQTRGVGFYNSNSLAGASQAHRHMQFIPGDEIWSLRNADATHVRVCMHDCCVMLYGCFVVLCWSLCRSDAVNNRSQCCPWEGPVR